MLHNTEFFKQVTMNQTTNTAESPGTEKFL